MAPRLEIVCDESGQEGENLVRTNDPVFAHVGVVLSKADAHQLVREVRQRTNAGPGELKARSILKSHDARVNAAWFLRDGIAASSAVVHLVDKRYFAIGKIVDLLIEEVAHERGIDLYSDGSARLIARSMFRDGNTIFGIASWETFLTAFVALMRTNAPGRSSVTVEDFYRQAEGLRVTASGSKLAVAMDLLVDSRDHMEQYRRTITVDPRMSAALDPLLAGISQIARVWFEQRSRPIVIVHDRQSTLTPARVEAMLTALRDPLREFRSFVSPVQVVGYREVDSDADPRVQVADLIAGVARVIAYNSLNGRPDVELCDLLRKFVDPFSLWGDDPSWSLISPGAGC